MNRVLLLAMFVVVGFFVVLAVRYLFFGQGWPGLFSWTPIYDPATFNPRRVWTATSFAALTYIGFDGLTTLAEDVENPKRNVLLATVLVCALTGVFGGLEVYLGQRVWPDWHSFPNLETAFMDISRRVGGIVLFNAMGFTLILAAFGSGLTGSFGAARLLFGMGRDSVLPRRCFGYLSRRDIPVYNVLIIGILSFAGAALLNMIGNAYEHAGELINFGAFLSFMGVNFAAFWQFAIRRRANRIGQLFSDIALPLAGFVFCGMIWLHLNRLAQIVGGIWFLIGLVYITITTRAFRSKPAEMDFTGV